MATNEPDQIDGETIKALEDRAANLRRLLEVRQAKRPLIVEFSGSPKAGKTRCISVLELFLKRNGIKTEVYTERASISPIKSKGHLNFNVWVSCASLQGMLESLYKDIDVFILDRGVFDALVWNEWLEMTGKVTHEEALQKDYGRGNSRTVSSIDKENHGQERFKIQENRTSRHNSREDAGRRRPDYGSGINRTGRLSR